MKYYIVGIKGVFLSSLALILNDLGFQVSGYDDNSEYRFTEDKLKQKNITIYTDENDYLTPGTVVVRSEHVSLEHSEIRKALDMGLRVYEYNEIVARLTKLFGIPKALNALVIALDGDQFVHPLHFLPLASYCPPFSP